LENRGVPVDTSILIDSFRKENKEISTLYKIQKNRTLYASTITEFEFPTGVKDDSKIVKHRFVFSDNEKNLYKKIV